MSIQVIDINGRLYALLKQITTGVTSVVWKAARLDGPAPSESEQWPECGMALRERLLREYPGHLDQTEGNPTLVAIKVPKTADMDTQTHQDQSPAIQDEARRLARLAIERSVAHLAPKLYEPAVESESQTLSLTLNPDMPVLVMAWINGTQVDELAVKTEEREAVILMRQLAEALRNLRSIPITATDTVKPNSLFVTPDGLRLIDWNLVGRAPSDFARITLPNAGQSAYRLMVGKGLRLDNNAMPVVDTIGTGGGAETWARLTLFTRELIRAMLTADLDRLEIFGGRLCAGDRPNEVAASLSQAWSRQNDLWLMSSEELLNRATSSGSPIARINCYDVAHTKLGISLAGEARDKYRQAALEWLNSINRLDEILLQLDWMRYRLAEDAGVRDLWLSARISRAMKHMNEQAQLEHYREWATLVTSNEPGQLVSLSSALMQSDESKALRLACGLRRDLDGSNRTLSQEEAIRHGSDFNDLQATWQSIHEKLGEGSGPSLSDLRQAVDQQKSAANQRAERLQARDEMEQDLSELFKNGEFQAASSLVKELLSCADNDTPELQRMAQALDIHLHPSARNPKSNRFEPIIKALEKLRGQQSERR